MAIEGGRSWTGRSDRLLRPAPAASRLWSFVGCVTTLAAAVMTAGCGASSRQMVTATPASDSVVRHAQLDVQGQLGTNRGYDGPATGPRRQHARLIVFIAADVTNGGIAGAAQGVQEATEAIGWKLKVLDGQATVAGRTEAMAQALTLRPDAIILGGFDPTEQRAAIDRAVARGVPIVGWHSGSEPGPNHHAHVFTNVTTDPLAVARLAARYVIARSGGQAGVAIFYDSQFRIAVAKANAMRAELARCSHCHVVALVDSPIADAPIRMPSIISSLLDRFGNRLTYMLAINGNYFSDSRAALFALGKSGTDPPFAVAAGDGDASELERIRSGHYQLASVAEPLYLQGWQLVDEINRALASQPPSRYLPPPRLITTANVPPGDVFDPQSDYRADYRRIWGVGRG